MENENNVIDFAKIKRTRYESKLSEKELSSIDFDIYGNPVPLYQPVNDEDVVVIENE